MRSRGAGSFVTTSARPFPSDLVVNDVSQSRLKGSFRA
jgi:hypothetical protein